MKPLTDGMCHCMKEGRSRGERKDGIKTRKERIKGRKERITSRMERLKKCAK